MKIVKRIIAATSILALIVCAVLGVQKGLFNELIDEFKNKNGAASEIAELTTYNAAEAQTATATASATNQNAIANAPKMATFNDSFFYDMGEAMTFDYMPSLLKGQTVATVRSASISDEQDAASLEYLSEPDRFSRTLADSHDYYKDGYYLISVEIQFTNSGASEISWGMGNCSIEIFDKNGQVNTNKSYVGSMTSGKISGDGRYKNGEIFLQAGETALCKWTGMLKKSNLDTVKDKSQQMFFSPSNMYYRSPSVFSTPGKLAFVELKLEVK